MINDRSFVTVVSGLPRSGTSLMMQMLSAGGIAVLVDAARQADEDNPRGYFELAAVKATVRDASWVEAAEGHAVKVVHALVSALPRERDYRVIVMRRAMQEVMRSQAAMLERRSPGRKSGDEQTLARTMKAQLERAVSDMLGDPHFAVLELDYADLVASPEAGAARISEFLGGGLDVTAMAAAVDPSLYRNRTV